MLHGVWSIWPETPEQTDLSACILAAVCIALPAAEQRELTQGARDCENTRGVRTLSKLLWNSAAACKLRNAACVVPLPCSLSLPAMRICMKQRSPIPQFPL